MENLLVSNEFETFSEFLNLFSEKTRYKKPNIFSKDEDISKLPDGTYLFELVRFIPENTEYDFVNFRIHLFMNLTLPESLKELGLHQWISLIVEIIIELDGFSIRVDKKVLDLEDEQVDTFSAEMLTPHIKDAISEYNSYISQLKL
jgi:hypothetical protein